MARATGFTCDNCGRFEIGQTGSGVAVAPPVGWYRLYPQIGGAKDRDIDNDANRLDLCGAECVAQHGATRVMEESGTVTYMFKADTERGPKNRVSRGPRKKGDE